MKRLIKNIRRSLLLVAVLVINLHMVIPHDHHRDITSGIVNTCPDSEKNNDQHPVFPPHCHALNDLVSERYFSLPVISNFDSWYVVIPDDINSIESFFSRTGICFLSFFLPESSLTEFSSLRAPPSVC